MLPGKKEDSSAFWGTPGDTIRDKNQYVAEKIFKAVESVIILYIHPDGLEQCKVRRVQPFPYDVFLPVCHNVTQYTVRVFKNNQAYDNQHI